MERVSVATGLPATLAEANAGLKSAARSMHPVVIRRSGLVNVFLIECRLKNHKLKQQQKSSNIKITTQKCNILIFTYLGHNLTEPVNYKKCRIPENGVDPTQGKMSMIVTILLVKQTLDF